jgi:DNA/RNA-binding domain of Phe-tRNA-synthetase-like protein
MEAHRYSIVPEVFAKYPGYIRGVVVAFDIQNGSSAAELVDLLRSEEEALRARLTLATLVEQPEIRSWREAYRAFGAKPSEFRSSAEAMARRVLHGDALPSINTLVDLGNVLSLRHLIPAGSHAIDRLTGDLSLRPATGQETFVALGSDTLEHPLPGEIIFAEGETVLTRRWTWRQGQHTLAQAGTGACEINVDGLPPTTPAVVEKVCLEAMDLVQRFCGGQARYEILSPEHPAMWLVP